VVVSVSGAVERLATEGLDVVIANVPGTEVLELCRRARETCPDVPVIVVGDSGVVPVAVAAMRAGAYDYLEPPLDDRGLGRAIQRALEHRRSNRDLSRLRRTVGGMGGGDLVGESRAMRALRSAVRRIAPTEASVLIGGESGTGKEVVARALHAGSRRSAAQFVAINCAALPESLLESELFGHTKGAFTGATSAARGLFVRADGGTLLLDEVGDMPMGLQPKLLRVLQERKIRPVGADRELPVDVRILAATNRDLRALVAEGRFREDLFHRLNVIELDLPPLRTRGRDLLLMARDYLNQLATRAKVRPLELTPAAINALLAYDWPGNVRELQNCMERAVALTTGPLIDADDLPERVRRGRERWSASGAHDPRALLPLRDVERRHVLSVLAAVGGNKSLAALILGMDRKTLYRRLEVYRTQDATLPPGSD
jgi:two-component system response regulator HydG